MCTQVYLSAKLDPSLAVRKNRPGRLDPGKQDAPHLGRLGEGAHMLSLDAFEVASNPEVTRWLEDHPGQAGELTADEIDELYSLQGTGGPLTAFGVETAVQHIERRRLAVD